MIPEQSVPKRLKYLAGFWLLFALASFLGIHLYLDLGAGPFDVGILGIVYGPGLILAWGWARKFMIVATWVGLATSTLMVIGGLHRCITVGGRDAVITFDMGIIQLVLLCVQLWVLKSREVTRYFELLARERDSRPLEP